MGTRLDRPGDYDGLSGGCKRGFMKPRRGRRALEAAIP